MGENIIVYVILGFFIGWLLSKYINYRLEKYGVDGYKEVNDYMLKTYGNAWSKLGNK